VQRSVHPCKSLSQGGNTSEESQIASVKVPEVEATFRHLDDADVPWVKVKSIRKADGTEAHVLEKWLAFSADPQYLTIYAKWDPGVITRRHGHFSPHVIFVMEGDMYCGDRYCPQGTHVELPFGASFGPFVAGESGAMVFEVMMGDPRPWGDDEEAFQATLKTQYCCTYRSTHHFSRLARRPSCTLEPRGQQEITSCNVVIAG